MVGFSPRCGGFGASSLLVSRPLILQCLVFVNGDFPHDCHGGYRALPWWLYRLVLAGWCATMWWVWRLVIVGALSLCCVYGALSPTHRLCDGRPAHNCNDNSVTNITKPLLFFFRALQASCGITARDPCTRNCFHLLPPALSSAD